MHTTGQNLFTRDDTIFGVCEGLGTDLGINPNILRIAFGVSLLGNPLLSVAAYLACGLLVAGTHCAFPSRGKVAAAVAETPLPQAHNDADEQAFAKAA